LSHSACLHNTAHLRSKSQTTLAESMCTLHVLTTPCDANAVLGIEVLSVRPSFSRVLCNKTKEPIHLIFSRNYNTRKVNLWFSVMNIGCWGSPLLSKILAKSDSSLFEKNTDFNRFNKNSASAVKTRSRANTKRTARPLQKY